MTRYLIKQVIMSLIKLFIFISLMFFLIQVIMPYDFVDQFAIYMNRTERAQLREQLGYDLPLYQQYWDWVTGVFRGDLGVSGWGYPVANAVEWVLPPTLLVFIPGTLIAFAIGLFLGKRTAWKGPGILSGATTLTGITLFTSFPPWLAWLIAYFFGRQASVARGQGGINSMSFPSIDRMLWVYTDLRPFEVAHIMFRNLVVIALAVFITYKVLERLIRRKIPGWIPILIMAGIAAGLWYTQDILPYTFDLIKSASLPMVTFILLTFGETMVIMQSTMTEVMQSEYIQSARAKGLPESVVREKHAARNALLPVLSRFFVSLPYLLAGIVIIEDSVNWPGMGSMMFSSLYWQDIPVVMGFLLMIGVLALVVRLGLDVLAAYMDPRIRFEERQVTARN